jgi:hypothetical protein
MASSHKIDIRLLIYYPFSSIIALFASILGNPVQTSAKRDLDLISAGRAYFETLSSSFEVADRLIEVTQGFETTASSMIGQEPRKRMRENTPYSNEQTQTAYPESDMADWLSNDLFGGFQASGSDFQAQLLQTSDMWMAPVSLDWSDWLDSIEKMPVQERLGGM